MDGCEALRDYDRETEIAGEQGGLLAAGALTIVRPTDDRVQLSAIPAFPCPFA
jgi:hypothetical protein